MSFWWRMWSRRLITAVISSQHWSWLQSKVNESCGSQKRMESQLHVQGRFLHQVEDAVLRVKVNLHLEPHLWLWTMFSWLMQWAESWLYVQQSFLWRAQELSHSGTSEKSCCSSTDNGEKLEKRHPFPKQEPPLHLWQESRLSMITCFSLARPPDPPDIR